MNRKLLFSFLAAVFVTAICITGCKKTDCSSVICDPCPGNRFMIAYQDTSGRCDSLVNANTRIDAFHKDSTWSGLPAFSYGLTSQCVAALILDKSYKYRIRCTSPAFMDTIRITSITFQEPMEITECCLCYPANGVTITLNGIADSVTFPAAQYENSPRLRIVP